MDEVDSEIKDSEWMDWRFNERNIQKSLKIIEKIQWEVRIWNILERQRLLKKRIWI